MMDLLDWAPWCLELTRRKHHWASNFKSNCLKRCRFFGTEKPHILESPLLEGFWTFPSPSPLLSTRVLEKRNLFFYKTWSRLLKYTAVTNLSTSLSITTVHHFLYPYPLSLSGLHPHHHRSNYPPSELHHPPQLRFIKPQNLPFSKR